MEESKASLLTFCKYTEQWGEDEIQHIIAIIRISKQEIREYEDVVYGFISKCDETGIAQGQKEMQADHELRASRYDSWKRKIINEVLPQPRYSCEYFSFISASYISNGIYCFHLTDIPE